jgi:hypothetical protein
VNPVTWTNLAATATAGSNTITLQTSVKTGDAAAHWQYGDRLVITSTSLQDHSEEVVVQSVSADGKTVTLAVALVYTHWGADGMFAEVGLLTRRVVLQGEAFDANIEDERTYGGHVIMGTTAEVKVIGVGFTNMGQFKNMGRYRACCAALCRGGEVRAVGVHSPRALWGLLVVWPALQHGMHAAGVSVCTRS